MTGLLQPLRSEHQDLLPHIEALREIAAEVGEASPTRLRADLGEAIAFLEREVLPHAQAEEAALYPAVASLMGATAATATMSRDHAEVERYVARLQDLRRRLSLGTPGAAELEQVRRALYGLHAVLTLHFAKEEEVYVPLLEERLSEAQARELLVAMEKAATAARRRSASRKVPTNP